jgi:hypothetical protein
MISIQIRMEGNISELGAKDLITNLHFLLLVMQLIPLHKHLRCLFPTVGSNSPKKFKQMDNSVRG